MVDSDSISDLLVDFDDSWPLYNELTKSLEILVPELLSRHDIPVHSIEARTKEREKFEEKINVPESRYAALGDITDISGVRIITYFLNDVDRASEIIKNEFEIDWENSVDKGAQLAPDRFGYLSRHYVAKLPESRLRLTEYKQFGDCKFEVQIRTILQHAWAEIEHDLGSQGDSTKVFQSCGSLGAC